MATLSHTSADIVQCVVFTPLFATLPPSLYIIRCDIVNFFYLLRYFSIYPSAPVRGWGFAFGAWVRDIENRDCLYKNPYLLKNIYTKIQRLLKSCLYKNLYPFKYLAYIQIQTLPNTLYKNPYKPIGRRAPNDEQYTSPYKTNTNMKIT